HMDPLGTISKYTYGTSGSDDRKLGNLTKVEPGKFANFGDFNPTTNHWQQITSADRDSSGNIVTGVPLVTTYAYQTQRDGSGRLMFSKVSESNPPSQTTGARKTTY